MKERQHNTGLANNKKTCINKSNVNKNQKLHYRAYKHLECSKINSLSKTSGNIIRITMECKIGTIILTNIKIKTRTIDPSM